MKTKNRILPVLIFAAAAFFLWYMSFAFPWGIFWIKLAVSAAVLAGLSLYISRKEIPELFSFRPRHLITGPLSAAVLYGVFWLGKFILSLVFAKSGHEIGSVYDMGSGYNIWIIFFLLLLVTSPCEEIFWRGFIQKRIGEKLSAVPAVLITSLIYALVHIWTLNLTLVLAAFTAGLGWGILYRLEKSIVPVIISHALWTVSVFVLFPFT